MLGFIFLLALLKLKLFLELMAKHSPFVHISRPNNTGDDTTEESVKAGDTIEVDGSKEIVIGVSEDGRYITMPFEDYINKTP